MADSDTITVWVVDDNPRHQTLVEFDSTSAHLDRQINEMISAVGWQPTWSIDIIQRDGNQLHILVVAAP